MRSAADYYCDKPARLKIGNCERTPWCPKRPIAPDAGAALNASMPAPADRLVIALAQIASIVGDIDGNLARLRARARRGRRRSAPIS